MDTPERRQTSREREREACDVSMTSRISESSLKLHSISARLAFVSGNVLSCSTCMFDVSPLLFSPVMIHESCSHALVAATGGIDAPLGNEPFT